MSETDSTHPKLRPVDAKPLVYEGAHYLLLRDPLELCDNTLLVPQPLIPVLSLCDGTRNLGTIRAAMALRYGIFLSQERLGEFVNALDNAFLLENERSQQALAAARDEFRRAPMRAPSSAGLSYPEDPQQLTTLLQGYVDQLGGSAASSPRAKGNGAVRGLISPHIDYQRGGPVYAQVWNEAAQSVREADLAIIIGTDHYSEGYHFSLTRQSYATPYGRLPTALTIVDELAGVIGTDAAFAGELHHRTEHSIELAAVWMHYIRRGEPIEMVPILTGSLDETGEEMIESVLSALRHGMQERRAIIIAAGDLAHVGPAFGGEPVSPGGLVRLKNDDDELIQAMCCGNWAGFNQAIQRGLDQNNICGVAPIHLTLRLLAPLTGQQHGYAVCPADESSTSFVTICGMTLH